MALTISKQGQYEGLESESDDRLERLFRQELATLEHEELVASQEQVEDLLLHRPNSLFQKAISVLAELVVMKSQPSPLVRLRILAGQGFLTMNQAKDIARYLTNEQVAKIVKLMSQVLIELRKRSDVIIPE
jgi:hypothetical protein